MGDELTMSLTVDERRAHYLAQTGRADLTPAQARRVRKAERRALSPHAAVARPSRLRKAFERKERRARHTEAVVLIHAIRTGLVGPMLSNLRRRSR